MSSAATTVYLTRDKIPGLSAYPGELGNNPPKAESSSSSLSSYPWRDNSDAAKNILISIVILKENIIVIWFPSKWSKVDLEE